MAEKLNSWLEKYLSDQKQKNLQVLVVSLVGKDIADITKSNLLNNYLGKNIFQNRNIVNVEECKIVNDEDDLSYSQIDVFFDDNENVLWLLLNDINDVAIQNVLFSSDYFKNKSFFERMEWVERRHLRSLAFLFQLSHAILFMEQGCRFDLDWIAIFKQLNRIRPKLCKKLRQVFSTQSENKFPEEKFPHSLLDAGRMGTPRLLFGFYRNPLRSDLNSIKKKELLEKMEKCLESQIATLLKQHGIVDTRFIEQGLAQTTIASGTPFVYCFNHSEMPSDSNHELAMTLAFAIKPNAVSVDANDDGSIGQLQSNDVQRVIDQHRQLKSIDKKALDPTDYNFHYFLHKALNSIRTNDRKSKSAKGRASSSSFPLELPTIEQFIESAKLVKKCLDEDWDYLETMVKIAPEMETIQTLADAAIQSAIAIYTRQLSLQPEVTGGGDSVFSVLEHEYTMKMAQEYLQQCYPRAAGAERREQMAWQLKNHCELTWIQGHQRCQNCSLTGQLCHFRANHVNDTASSLNSSRDRSASGSGSRGRKSKQQQIHRQFEEQTRKNHCSGVKTFSMCNCGLSRRIREDPFTLKDANFDFYNDTSDFSFGACCARLDKYEFKLFDPTSATQSTLRQSPSIKADSNRVVKNKTPELDKSQKQTLKTDQIVDDEAGPAGDYGMDPSEFNVRFFDENDGDHLEELGADEEHYQGSNGNGDNRVTSPAAEGMATQPDDIYSEPDEAEDNDDDEEEEEDDENVRRPNLAAASSDEEEDIDNREAEIKKLNLSPSGSSSGGSPPPELHYLDEYDLHLTSKKGPKGDDNASKLEKREIGHSSLQTQQQLLDDPKLLEKFKGQFLECVPHTSLQTQVLRPLFPSFSVVCMGHSSVYNHSTGIRAAQGQGTARFRNGSEFLLPCTVELLVNTEQWVRELQYIGVNPSDRTMRNLQNSAIRGKTQSTEKVKLFIGFDYECPRGHRFMVGPEPGKVLKHKKAAGPCQFEAAGLLNADQPIWMPCPCRKEPRTTAQLMRIHVVTPKAPVSVLLQPMIEMPEEGEGFFFPGASERIELGWAKYYVCRLPYAYVGPSGVPAYKPNGLEFRGRLLRQCINVSHLPISLSNQE